MKSYVVTVGLCTLLVVFTLGITVQASGGYLVVTGDSCAYEVALAIVEKYGYTARVVPYTWITEIPRDVVVVVLFTNATPQTAFDQVLDLVKSAETGVVVTDVFYEYATSRTPVNILNTISSEDLWLYCVYRDESALARVERALRVRTAQFPSIPLVVTIVSVATVASLQVQPRTRARTLNALRKLAVLVTGFISLLHMKIKKEDIFNHPVRLEILRVLLSRGEVSFSELQREIGCSRATLEWHISLLIRARIIEELRAGRKRVFRLNNYNPIPRLTASQVDQGIYP